MKTETIRVGQVGIKFLLEAAGTNGSMAMFEFAVPVGAKVPLPHYHKEYDETIYGVEGVVTFTVDDKLVDIGPGESCFIPRGAVHGFNNRKQTDVQGVGHRYSWAYRSPVLQGDGSADKCGRAPGW